MAAITDDVLTREEMADEFLLMGFASPKASIRALRNVGGPSAGCGAHRDTAGERFVETTSAGRLRVTCRAFRCSMRWSPIWRREAYQPPTRRSLRRGRDDLRSRRRDRSTASPRSLVPSAGSGTARRCR